MLTLSLLRHAKSAWDDPALDDYDRGLAPRGLKAATQMGRAMKALEIKPDLVLCSSAIRTRATLALLLPELGGPPPEIRYNEALYLSSPATLLDLLAKVPETYAHVMILAHNPGLHALALELTGAGERKMIGELAAKFPTAALAVLTFDAERWNALQPGTGRLERFLTPRGLKD